MATVTASSRTASVPSLTTPQILSRTVWMIWVLVIAFVVALAGSVWTGRAVLQAVGNVAVPAMLAAQRIKLAIADMDASAATELRSGSAQNADALRIYELRRQEAAQALIEAARSVKRNNVGKDPILRVQLGLGAYEADIQKARDLRQTGNASWIAAYHIAVAWIDQEILPAVETLEQMNLDVFNRTYQTQHKRFQAWRAALSAIALLMLIVLASIQLFVTGRTHRLINFPLLLATCLIVGSTCYSLQMLAQARQHLEVARADSFVAAQEFWHVRATAYAARMEETRYLLDEQNARKYQQEFSVKMDRLTHVPMSEAQPFLSEYVKASQQWQTLESNGHQQEAAAFFAGMKPGELNYAFQQLDQALNKTLLAQQMTFDRAVAGGFAALNSLETKMALCVLLVGILSLLGLMPRIREYQ